MPIIFQIFAQYLSTLFAETKHPLRNISQNFWFLVCACMSSVNTWQFYTIWHCQFILVVGLDVYFLVLNLLRDGYGIFSHPELKAIKSRVRRYLTLSLLSVINHHIFCNQTENRFYRAVMHMLEIHDWCNCFEISMIGVIVYVWTNKYTTIHNLVGITLFASVPNIQIRIICDSRCYYATPTWKIYNLRKKIHDKVGFNFGY